ncbi:hypothetical protein B0G69_7822 [Paraburkholderia sp. RAU2J]|uniref:hypothetical protein n=1 Tax=Paraburkholderia sp. RAU2J TaxID=1938810 RepID=UPI000F29996D|nr:hypothetical protein [Paraburkholderia sp. RAU2J]RKT10427.1 hypothetical protein B0G69_7822 [Paraburkholderia sp. RAU2J]
MLTQCCEATGQTLGLVPAWFWTDAEPPITALLDELELGMPSVRQHDPGDARWLTDPNREPQRREGPLGTHAGARRIAGGTARLVDTQAAALPAACVRTGSALLMLRDRGA